MTAIRHIANRGLIEDLMDTGLLVQSAYVGGEWIRNRAGAVQNVYNPADGALIGTVPDLSIAEASTAIDAAYASFPAWAATLPADRAQKLRSWYELINDARDDLALLMTLEQGKPLSEARGEIEYAASFIEWYAGEAGRMGVESITPHLHDRDMQVVREPLGVAALITPWNFPSAMITRKAAAAMAAGCTVVVKPAPETPFSAIALAALAEKAGIPAGVFNVITGDAPKLATMLCESPHVRALDRKSTRLNSSHSQQSRMPSSARKKK